MGRRVVGFDARATLHVQAGLQRLPRTQRARLHRTHMQDKITAAFRAVNSNTNSIGLKGAGVPHLATHLGINIGPIEIDRHLITRLSLIHQIPGNQKGTYGGGAPFMRISRGVIRGGNPLGQSRKSFWRQIGIVPSTTSRSAAFACGLHLRFVRLQINLKPRFFRHDLGKVNRESEGVVQTKGRCPINHFA